jgi:Uma2 family endonuclease
MTHDTRSADYHEIVTVAQRITADEYLLLDLPRGTQLIDGLIVLHSPRMLHQVLHGRLFRAIDGWVTADDGRGIVVSPLDVLIDDRNVFAPDLLWYAAAHVPAIRQPPPYPVPDLAIEIRSPSTWRYDVAAKKDAYEREGLRELWLVDGESGVLLVLRRSAEGRASFDVALELDRSATLESPLLPGFALDVGALLHLG